MTISIERTILNTQINGLDVIKHVEKTDLPLKDSQEFCIGVSVAKELVSDNRFLAAEGFATIRFFGETYEDANDQYLEWLDTVVSDNDATYNKARGVQCLLNELKGAH